MYFFRHFKKQLNLTKIFFLLLLIGFNVSTYACEFPEVTFKADFSAAHLDECKQLSSKSYLLTIKPENYPINNSPWYAFKVTSTKEQTINVAIEYIQGKHRYKPKVSNNGKNWTPHRHKVSKGKLKFKLDVSNKPVWVSAQEIIDNQFYLRWLKRLSKNHENKIYELGKSTEQRAIYQLVNSSTSKEWVVLIGRMHPPEVTGAMALFLFSAELLSDSALATSFRKRFNILLIPNINPDGVEHGHWRSNINGVDLNRDWKNFKQQETRLVRDQLQEIVASGGKIVFAIDFHSTSKNIFYTMPTDYGIAPQLLAENWLKSLDKAMPELDVNIKPGSSSKGVFKQYIADTYEVQAITYEMGDNTNRPKIRAIAKTAAQKFMEKLLDTPADSFYVSQ